MDWFGIRDYYKNIIPVCPAENGERRRKILTTVMEQQHEAEIEIFYCPQSRQPVWITGFIIDRIPGGHKGVPDIECEFIVSGNNLEIILEYGGNRLKKNVETGAFLHKTMPARSEKNSAWRLIALSGIVLAAAPVLFFLFKKTNNISVNNISEKIQKPEIAEIRPAETITPDAENHLMNKPVYTAEKISEQEKNRQPLPPETAAGHKPAEISPSFHEVKKDDTLRKISQKYFGDEYHMLTIAQKNNITNPDLIFPGERFEIDNNNSSLK
ncbi:MAG: hypothetical protein A2096_00800 [Spirochaetes bacterium GWF1_41_5]|nr:MAG: hypothetical protein A2096_00800 [Spirochaetes bacterium GWF1_41_5]HBE03540.1 hypothetical protein [Spirochaetia bacterium]